MSPHRINPFVVMIPRFLFFLSTLATTLCGQDGQQLFTLYCSACHGSDGKGATGGTFPPLAESPWLSGDPDRAIKIVLKGVAGPIAVSGKTYNLEMPPQGAVLPDDQIAAILTFVRSAWGNQAGTVTTDQVKTIRASVAGRNTPWTAAEILKLHPLPFEKTALTNLLSQAYPGKWDRMPDFTNLKATNIEEEHDGVISLKKSPFQDNFAMVWEAGFDAPASGEYQFALDADDAAAVIIDGKQIVEVKGNGPMNNTRAKQAKTKLTKGSHKFRVEYLEHTGNQGIAIGWKGPGVKNWKWLTDDTTKPAKIHEPIPITPVNGRPVIYRNFIAGTTPRAIGVAFPGGLNLAYSADNLAPELLWTGKFIDGAAKWLDRGTANNPPAGEKLVKLTNERGLPGAARFRGYQLDSAGNPTFSVEIGSGILHDSWQAESSTLVRKLALTGSSSPLDFVLSDHPIDGEISVVAEGSSLKSFGGRTTIQLDPGKPVTLTYRWK